MSEPNSNHHNWSALLAKYDTQIKRARRRRQILEIVYGALLMLAFFMYVTWMMGVRPWS